MMKRTLIAAGVVFALTSCGAGFSEENSKEETYFDLGEIVVTATRTPHLLKDVPVSTTVVSREEIEEVNAKNIGEALEKVAGVKVNSYGAVGATTLITLRGSTSNQVLVLVDGRPVDIASLGTADLSMYPVDNVERIEVVRGPASALYGANALGGVVNVITKDPPEEPSTELYSSYGTFNTQLYRLNHGAAIGRFGYLITASQSSSDGDRENSESTGHHFTGKVNYDLSDQSGIVFATGYSRQDKGVPGSTSWLTPEANQDDEKNWFDLTHKLRLGEDSEIASKIFFNRHWLEYENPDSLIDDISKNYRLGVDLQHSLLMSDVHTLTWGINWERDEVEVNDINGDSRIGGKQELTTRAGYLQDEITVFELLTLTPGVRYDDHSVYGSEISPRLSGLYRLTEKTSLRASVGRAFRAPTVDDLYWRDEFAVGNPDLEPEKSIGYDIGIEHQFSTMTLGRASLFRSDVDDLITWADPDGDFVWEPINVEKARIQGVEAEVKTQFNRQLSGSLIYTYLDARDKGETYYDKYLRYKPRHKGGYRLKYESKRGLKISLGLEYNDSVYTDRGNSSELGSFLLLDTRISQIVGSDTEIFIAGENLLDEEYQLYDGYPMPGLSITAGVKVGF